MKKFVLLISLLGIIILVGGCGAMQRAEAKWTGEAVQCVDGVNYIQFTSGASVKYNTNGTISLCK
jgi:hypothetical protein